MLLSVCLITKNEEKFIAKCLDSVSNVANEIIIVDSGSTDKTIEIAKKKGAEVFNINWIDDYSYARNEAITHAKGDWILFLDADEYISDQHKLLKEIKKIKNKKIGGLLIERLDLYRDKKSRKIDSYPVGMVRIFRNLPNIRFKGIVHEQINSSIIENNLIIGIVKTSKIIHQVMMSSDSFLDKKQEYYLSLIENETRNNLNNWWMHYQRAKTLWYFEKNQLALLCFKYLKDKIDCPITIRCSSYCNFGLLLSQTGSFEEAKIEIQKSLNLNPKQSLGYLLLGNIYYKEGNFKMALKSYSKVATKINLLKYNEIIPGDLYVYPEEKLFRLALCYLSLGRKFSGVFLLRKALKINKDHTNSLFALARIEAGTDNQKALAKINRCLELNPDWRDAVEYKQKLSS